MKKFVVVMIVSFLMSISVNFCSAKDVRVSDYGVDGFVINYNKIANSTGHSNILINDIPILNDKVNIAGYLYDSYAVVCGSRNSGVIINFWVTLDGYISRIIVYGDRRIENSAYILGQSVSAILFTLGMTHEEYDNFWNLLGKNNFNGYYWCRNANRYINCEFKSKDVFSYVMIYSDID